MPTEEIRKLKKRIKQEEIRRRRKKFDKPLRLIGGILLVLLLAASGTILYYRQTLDQRLVREYNEGLRSVDQGAYVEAAELFRQLREDYPRRDIAPKALYQEGEVHYLFLKQFPEALVAYLILLRDHPDSDLAEQAQRKVAEIYKYSLRDYPRAIVAYQKLLDFVVTDGDRIQYEVADSYFRLENFEQARIEFESLLKNYPESPLQAEALYRIGVALSLEGEQDQAEKVFQQITAEWPDSPFVYEARFGLAGIYEERSELQRALDLLLDLQENYPKPEVLQQKIDQVRDRIAQKKKAI